ncbi:MAG: DNA cytosine methyltransferase [Gemmatales bacterium]
MAQASIPILSFFCGAGGLDHGFSREQFRVVLACDNFEPAIHTYNYNAKRDTARLTDLNTIKAASLIRMIEGQSSDNTPQGVVGGPPCQGFSRGNAKADPNDPRNLLPFRYAEILSALNEKYKLKFFVFENVLGLTNATHSARFYAIWRAFEKAGFTIFDGQMDAQNFGVAQMRRRLFLVGLNSELFPDAAFIFPSDNGKRATIRDVIEGLPQPMFFKHGLKPSDIAYHPNHWTMQPRSKKLMRVASTDGRSFRKLQWDSVSPTVAYGNREIHVHPDGGRRLSVLEAMLLQGFPKRYRLSGNFSQQITQISNAVPPPVARALAKRIRRAIFAKE